MEMKRMFFKAAAVCMGMMMSVALTACGDEEEAAAPVPANRGEKVTVAYDGDLSEDYFELWDIEVTYTPACCSSRRPTPTSPRRPT